MSFSKYPAYKDSGVEWLGEVPVGWAVHPLKRAIERIESGTSVNAADHPAEPGSFGVLKTSCVYTGQFDWTENKTVNDEDLIRVSCPVKKNTLIVSRMNTPELVGATGLVTEAPEGIFLPDRLWQVYFTDNHSPSFLFYFTKSHEYREQVKMACSGTSASMQNLGQDDFRGLLFAEPSKSEQTQIARFLDHETARIDALIEEQQRLIELLKEKRQAVISHAVTKGLDPTVPMKDSGVEWLGEVPAHWEVTKLGWILNELTYGFTNPMPTEDDGPAMLTANDIGWDTVLYEQARSTSEIAFREMLTDKSRPKAGDLLLTKDGTLGRVAVHDGRPACINQSVALIRPDTRIMSSEFLCSLLQASCYQTKMIFDAGGTTIKHIYITILAKMNLAVPSLDEQQALLNFISNETCKFDRLTSEAEQVVNLLQERRSALISAAVTGKIDVRNWQPPAGQYPAGNTQNRTEPEVA